MSRTPRGRLAACSLLSLVILALSAVRADPFTPGNLVVLTVGDGSLSVGSNAATPVSLREYTTGGSFVAGSLVTFSSTGSGTKLTQSGNQSLEGSLSLSADGQYLTLVGYNAGQGKGDVASTSTNGNPNPNNDVVRVVGRVDLTGGVSLTTTTVNYSSVSIRSATTTDGTRIYTGGASDDLSASLRTTTFGATGNTPLVNAVDTRVVHVFNNQLYASTKSGTIVRTDTALPTTGSNVTDLVTGIVDPVGFVVLDQDGNGTPDTLYVANQEATASLQKYSSTDGTTWTARGSANIAVGLTGITAVKNGTAVDIYATAGDGTVAGNTLQRFTDTAAFNADLTGSFALLATAPSGAAFRGVAFGGVAVPEPGSLLLGGAACAGLAGVALGRRGRLPGGAGRAFDGRTGQGGCAEFAKKIRKQLCAH
ncbi:MAG: PEP-CTERM sorting domain-containing protein [Gemmataceae bacterium]